MLRALCSQGRIVWTAHAVQRLVKRGISKQEVTDAILDGEVIEDYPDDYPFPSCLILGSNKIHVVCGVGEGQVWIITAYRPDTDKWETNLKTRRKENDLFHV